MSITMDDVKSFLSGLRPAELANLNKDLQTEWGVELPTTPIMVQQPNTQETPTLEVVEFDVFLEETGTNKMAVLKEVRVLTGLGLKEAKELVESAPRKIKEAVTRDDAAKYKTTLESAGAKVAIKPAA